jgi:DNA-binding CsgD family transcriptional regulator
MGRLLERDAELAALGRILTGLDDGQGGVVLIGGEAGIGKTSLVRELRDRAGGSPAFLVGACEPLSVPAPLAPVRELAEAAGGADPAALAGDRLLVARSLLEALEARAPAVAVIEDAHWADPTTLDIVRLLARRLEGTAVALLLTYRDDEVGANPALAGLLGDLATRPGVRRIGLQPLSATAVGELAAPTGADPAQLARVTGGNPFLVVEALAAGERLPATVRDATLARAGRLDPRARALVEAAAVIGQRVPPRLLEAVAPGSAGAVEEALARGIMVAEGDALGFRHELIRAAVEDSIPPPRRAELHARVVAALAARPGDPDHARLAHHAELAGLVAAACRYAALAATEAERVGALRETSLQAERALRLGSSLPASDRLDLLLMHSRAANFASTRLEEAVTSAGSAEALAVSLDDPVRRGRALLALAGAQWSADHVVEAREAAIQAVAVLDGTDATAERARAHALRVRVEATTFDPAAALELARAAHEVAAAAAFEEARIDVAISAGLARGHLGAPDALEQLAVAAREARTAGLPIQTVRAHVNLVFIAATWRRHDEVDRRTAEALAVFDEHQTPIPANAVEFYRARSLLDRGRWAEAEAVAAQPGRAWAAEASVVGATSALLAGRRGERPADALLDAARDRLRRAPETSRHGTLRVMLVELAWLRGDRAAAARHVRTGLASEAAGRFARPAADLAVWAARLGLAVDPPPGAPAAVIAELAGDWRRAGQEWRGLEAPYEAALAALPGDDRAAREALAALHRLGAAGAARAFARDRAEAGRRALRGPRRATALHPVGLTRREQDVLERLATGATNPAIAATLQLSERTVAHHVSAILRKLGAPTRLAAVERARARGLVGQDGPAGSQT